MVLTGWEGCGMRALGESVFRFSGRPVRRILRFQWEWFRSGCSRSTFSVQICLTNTSFFVGAAEGRVFGDSAWSDSGITSSVRAQPVRRIPRFQGEWFRSGCSRSTFSVQICSTNSSFFVGVAEDRIFGDGCGSIQGSRPVFVFSLFDAYLVFRGSGSGQVVCDQRLASRSV